MANPEVSIIMPVYNGSRHLSKAIGSVLQQSFSNFELIIVNDGSTDDSEQIISSFTDPRIKYIAIGSNKGLINALNSGIEAATGKYLARMDADDICVRERLAVQKEWLDKNAGITVLASRVEFIDENDQPAGNWKEDVKADSAKAIRRMLPVTNCIAHPSVMVRTDVIKKYRYNSWQKHIEDYDLWLRLAADGKIIDKTDRVLLLYRIHSQSITGKHLKPTNVFFRLFHCKRKFLYHRIVAGKFGFFDIRVFFCMIRDLIMGVLKTIKRIVVKG